MKSSKRVDWNGSQQLIISQNINLIILVSMRICTINLDGVHFRYFQITCRLIMATKENGSKKSAKKQKDLGLFHKDIKDHIISGNSLYTRFIWMIFRVFLEEN